MKSHLLNRASTTLISVLFLFFGCDRLAGVDPTVPDCIPAPGVSKANCTSGSSNEFAIRFTPEKGTTSLLFSATGALEDEGRVEGNIMHVDRTVPLPESWKGVRALRGSKGIVVVSFEGQSFSETQRVLTGRFAILDDYCTGAYSGLRGEGTFKVNFDGNRVRLEELFTGKITPPEV